MVLIIKNDKRSRYFIAQRNYDYETNLTLENRSEDSHTYKNVETAIKDGWNDLTLEEWKEKVIEQVISNDKPKIEKVAFILHDQDLKSNGETKPPHIHLLIQYKDAQYMETVKKKLNPLNTREKNLEIPEQVKSAGRYLTHISENAIAKGKYIYSPEELIIYQRENDKLERITQPNEIRKAYVEICNSKTEVKKALKEEIQQELKDIMNRVATGQLTLKRASMEWSDKFENKNVDAFLAYDKEVEKDLEFYRRNYILKKKKRDKNQVIYIYGAGGLGKTTIAKVLAQKLNLSQSKSPDDTFFTAAGQATVNTMFGNYDGENVIIADEVNNQMYKTKDEFCGIHTRSLIPTPLNQRFKNKQLISQAIIYTQNTPTVELAKKFCGKFWTKDSMWQIVRRIDVSVELNELNAKKIEAKILIHYKPALSEEIRIEEIAKVVIPRKEIIEAQNIDITQQTTPEKINELTQKIIETADTVDALREKLLHKDKINPLPIVKEEEIEEWNKIFDEELFEIPQHDENIFY